MSNKFYVLLYFGVNQGVFSTRERAENAITGYVNKVLGVVRLTSRDRLQRERDIRLNFVIEEHALDDASVLT